MIKAENGLVSIKGSATMLISELALVVKAIREPLVKEYGEPVVEQLINRAVETSKADGDLDKIMKALINDVLDILSKANCNKDTQDMSSILEQALRKAFGLH
jgi:hypothetical protein|uniref:Uncharacterized protein n=1 Tax=Myoviridae sp. ctBbR2 TaxID=2827667 RepID=A0A8S5SG56_9CAUD|nr:MAG TPA: hypothetical protein [Myoviridae sp. ctBbR2]